MILSTWLNNLRTLAGLEQQLGVDNIIGIDIFNEPWDYTWAEWSSLAASAYQAINEVNPNLLIFVQGISASAGNQDGTPDTIVEVPHAKNSIRTGVRIFSKRATIRRIFRRVSSCTRRIPMVLRCMFRVTFSIQTNPSVRAWKIWKVQQPVVISSSTPPGSDRVGKNMSAI